MDKKAPAPDKSTPDPSELKIALDNRAFEIQLFWQRSNYFLVLMTALGIGTFTVKDPIFSPVIALFATACSYYWFRTNLGSKFWQESWEVEVAELSKEFGVRSFERSLADVREQVRRSLANGQASERRSVIRRWIDRMTVKKYSVTYNMILLSLVSTFLWSLVAVALVVRSVTASTYEAPEERQSTTGTSGLGALGDSNASATGTRVERPSTEKQSKHLVTVQQHVSNVVEKAPSRD